MPSFQLYRWQCYHEITNLWYLNSHSTPGIYVRYLTTSLDAWLHPTGGYSYLISALLIKHFLRRSYFSIPNSTVDSGSELCKEKIASFETASLDSFDSAVSFACLLLILNCIFQIKSDEKVQVSGKFRIWKDITHTIIIFWFRDF